MYSFNTWNHSVLWGLEPSLDRQITAAAAAGCEYVGLDLPSIRACGADRVRGWLEEAGVGCYELVALRLPEEDAGPIAEVVDQLGARAILAVPSGPLSDELVDATARAAAVLADHGASLCLEFLPSLEINSIDATLRLIGAAGQPAAKVLVDSWHFFAGPSTWESLESLPAELLGCIQFDDANPPVSDDMVWEYRNNRAIPGEGTLDLERFARTLRAVDPTAVVSIEVLSEEWRRRPPEELVVASVEATRRYFG